MSTSPYSSDQIPRAASSLSSTPSPRPASSDGRKRLPSIPSPDVQQLMSRIPNKTMPTAKAANGHGPFYQEYNLMAEYNQLCSVKVPGVYIVPSALSAHIWNGVLFIRKGMYQEGVFRFTLNIPENFPDVDCDSPGVVFEYPIFHPQVDPASGKLDVKRVFPKWRRNVNHIWQVLLYARKIFHKIETKTPLNQSAADLYDSDPEAYRKRVHESVQSSKQLLYDPPPSDDRFAIRFSKWDPGVHEEALEDMLDPKVNQVDGRSGSPPSQSLSWVSLDSPTILSRDDPATA